MSKEFARITTKRNKTAEPPMDRWDLARAGLPVDHFYCRFVELGRQGCPRCGSHHLNIARKNYAKNKGWEWCCMECSQRWREPKITVGLCHGDQKEPDNPNIIITEYK